MSTTWTAALVPELGSQAPPGSSIVQGQEALTVCSVQERSRVPSVLAQTGSLLHPNPGPSGRAGVRGERWGCAREPSTQWGSWKK